LLDDAEIYHHPRLVGYGAGAGVSTDDLAHALGQLGAIGALARVLPQAGTGGLFAGRNLQLGLETVIARHCAVTGDDELARGGTRSTAVFDDGHGGGSGS
jgi:hypothetical protein